MALKESVRMQEPEEEAILQKRIDEIREEITIADSKIDDFFERISEVSDSLILGCYIEREKIYLEFLEVSRASLDERRRQKQKIYYLEQVFKDYLIMEKGQHEVEIQRQEDLLSEQLKKREALSKKRD